MLNQKDNDFDDLFRRASDKYPLRTDSADWDRMAAALDDPSSALPETQDTDKRRKRRFIWFFLLLPLGGAGYYIFHQAGSGHGHAVATESVVKAPASGAGGSGSGASGAGTVAGGASENGAATVAGGEGKSVDGSVAGGAGKGTADAGGSGKTGGSARVSTTVPAAKGSSGAVNPGGGAAVTPGVMTPVAGKNIAENRHAKNRVGGIKDAAPGGVVGGATSGKVGGARSGVVGASKDRGVGAADGMAGEAGGGVVGDATKGMVGGGRDVGNGKSVPESRVASRDANYPVNRAHIAKDYNLTVNVVAPVVAKDSSKVKPKASSKQKSSFLYAGLLAAPDLSTVKFQSTKGVGTTYSLLLGYQFNKRWAIESGVSLDRKRYYTDGEYFDTKGVHLYNGEILNNVDGTCYMWEIPVNVRYNFSQTEKSKWFATAGLSTYFMTREKYKYNYTINNWSADSNWDLKKPSQYWFSIINLSAGYEHRLGGIGNLRIEPYLRIPLAGVGTGKLNILSTGINIGITRRLW